MHWNWNMSLWNVFNLSANSTCTQCGAEVSEKKRIAKGMKRIAKENDENGCESMRRRMAVVCIWVAFNTESVLSLSVRPWLAADLFARFLSFRLPIYRNNYPCVLVPSCTHLPSSQIRLSTVCQYPHVSAYLSGHPKICPTMCLPTYCCVYLFFHLPIFYMYLYLFISWSISHKYNHSSVQS